MKVIIIAGDDTPELREALFLACRSLSNRISVVVAPQPLEQLIGHATIPEPQMPDPRHMIMDEALILHKTPQQLVPDCSHLDKAELLMTMVPREIQPIFTPKKKHQPKGHERPWRYHR
jgi:hypothetical protein